MARNSNTSALVCALCLLAFAAGPAHASRLRGLSFITGADAADAANIQAYQQQQLLGRRQLFGGSSQVGPLCGCTCTCTGLFCGLVEGHFKPSMCMQGADHDGATCSTLEGMANKKADGKVTFSHCQGTFESGVASQPKQRRRNWAIDGESIGCAVADGALSLLFKSGSKVVTEATCVGYDVAVDAACELIGLGPEDPAADACAIILDVAIETACQVAVKAGSTLAKSAVKKALKC